MKTTVVCPRLLQLHYGTIVSVLMAFMLL